MYFNSVFHHSPLSSGTNFISPISSGPKIKLNGFLPVTAHIFGGIYGALGCLIPSALSPFVQCIKPLDVAVGDNMVEANNAGPLGPKDNKFVTQDDAMYVLVLNEVSGTLSVCSQSAL